MGPDVVVMHLALASWPEKEEQGGGAPLPEEVVSKSNYVIEREDCKPLIPPAHRMLCASGATGHYRAHGHLHRLFRGDRACAATALGEGEQEIQRPREELERCFLLRIADGQSNFPKAHMGRFQRGRPACS